MSGTRVTIDGGDLVVEPLGMDKLWSFRREVRVPLNQVKHAFFDPTLVARPGRLRAPGLRLPWKVSGTFFAPGSRQFWNVSGTHRSIVIELAASAFFDRLVVSVDEPLRTVDAINAAHN